MKANAQLLAVFAIALVGVHVVNLLTGYQLSDWGIRPRYIASLPHVFSAPFLHGSVTHLLNNLLPFLVLSVLLLMRSRRYYLQSLLFITVCTGLLVWAFARDAIHIGASGVVFGLWALCLANAWFQRSWKSVVVAALVFFLYGGLIFGLLPQQPGISFESHIFGAVAGVAFAYFSKRKGAR